MADEQIRDSTCSILFCTLISRFPRNFTLKLPAFFRQMQVFSLIWILFARKKNHRHTIGKVLLLRVMLGTTKIIFIIIHNLTEIYGCHLSAGLTLLWITKYRIQFNNVDYRIVYPIFQMTQSESNSLFSPNSNMTIFLQELVPDLHIGDLNRSQVDEHGMRCFK